MREIDRRTFLELGTMSAAVTVAGGAIARTAPAWGRPAGSPNERIRIAVLGVRGRGRAHVDELSGIADVEVAAVCDPDTRVLGAAADIAERRQGRRPKELQDFRGLLDDPSIHAFSIATPDHWHALATIWACQAGKDVYVEKPCSHNVREGRRMVDAARKYGRIVQHGTQSRSGATLLEALEFLRSKPLGAIRMAKVINHQLREDIGKRSETVPPSEVDYDLWLGPSPRRRFHPNRFHYNWHWNWDYGTGDIGNDGVHALDYARWFLGVEDPIAISASGAKLHFDDDQETPDTQVVTYEFPGVFLLYEMRIWTPYQEHGMENGAVLYGEKGRLTISPQGWSVTWRDNSPGPSGPGRSRGPEHFRNFIDCLRSRTRPNAHILEGHLSSRLAHFGNIATRVGRRLVFDRETESFRGDEDANRLLGREYRSPFVVPEEV
jgi:predicted dehydrogenase